jgi:hypothetical protein
VDEARRLLRELEQEQPRYRGFAQAVAAHPEMPALDEILTE